MVLPPSFSRKMGEIETKLRKWGGFIYPVPHVYLPHFTPLSPTDSRRAESVRNPTAVHVKFGDDCANAQPGLSQWTAALKRLKRRTRR